MEMEGRIGNAGNAAPAPPPVTNSLPPEIANDPFLRMEMEGRIGNTPKSDIYSPAAVHTQRYGQQPSPTTGPTIAAPTPPRRAEPQRRSGW